MATPKEALNNGSRTPNIAVHGAAALDILSLAQNESDALYTYSAEEGPSLLQIMFGAPTAERISRRAEGLLMEMQKNPEIRMFKAVVIDENMNSKIVGFAQFRYYTDPLPHEDGWQDQIWEGAANPMACNEFIGALARNRNKYMGGKRFICMSRFTLPNRLLGAFPWGRCTFADTLSEGLEILTVDPAYQRQGIGSQLISAGLKGAERLGLYEAYVESSPAAYRLYRKWRFEEVETIITDKEKYGGKGVERTACMIRRASAM